MGVSPSCDPRAQGARRMVWAPGGGDPVSHPRVQSGKRWAAKTPGQFPQPQRISERFLGSKVPSQPPSRSPGYAEKGRGVLSREFQLLGTSVSKLWRPGDLLWLDAGQGAQNTGRG